MMLLGSITLSACGTHTTASANKALLTAQDAAECTMARLKALDLEGFNECTDNYVETYYNWIGMPVEKEYRVFNELLQPGIKTGKWKNKYEFNN